MAINIPAAGKIFDTCTERSFMVSQNLQYHFPHVLYMVVKSTERGSVG